MCHTCGCGQSENRIEGQPLHGHEHHHHDHVHEHSANYDDHGPAHAHASGMSQTRMIQIEQDILAKNNEYAQANRNWLAQHGVLSLNLVSSPGSGKTSLLTRTLDELSNELPVTVIEGDQETSRDAERIRATGVKAVQINTGKGCHLDAHQIGHAIDTLSPPDGALLFIENVGNLICPAAFDLGEAHKVAILSVTEGEDKPIKYPDMFHAAGLLLLNKIDLLPYVQFDVARCIDYARLVNPGIQVFQLSATGGEGMEAWYQWLRMTRQAHLTAHCAAGIKQQTQPQELSAW